jgi:hypothetical protein
MAWTDDARVKVKATAISLPMFLSLVIYRESVSSSLGVGNKPLRLRIFYAADGYTGYPLVKGLRERGAGDIEKGCGRGPVATGMVQARPAFYRPRIELFI